MDHAIAVPIRVAVRGFLPLLEFGMGYFASAFRGALDPYCMGLLRRYLGLDGSEQHGQ